MAGTRTRQIYSPSYVKSLAGAGSVTATASDVFTDPTFTGDDNVFKYDPISSPLRSTQQLNIDWANFSNHTFFASAEVKVNETFNVLVNNYPFDGSKEEYEVFFGKMTGFEKYIYENFPRWRGALHFSGTTTSENPSGGYPAGRGTWVTVKDKAGTLYPALARNSTGDTIINPGADDSMTIEAHVYLPSITNSTQVILQKVSSSIDGFSLHLEPSVSTSTVTAVFSVASGSHQNKVSATLKKGQFNHVAAILNKEDHRVDKLQLYLNEELAGESVNSIKFGELKTWDSDLTIGSGSAFYSAKTLVTPTQTFSGTLDELRIFHSVRTKQQQKLHATKGIYSTPELKLYYRFNEPPLLSLNETDSVNSILLDSSGNSLHSMINNFTSSLRLDMTAETSSPMRNEKDEHTIVLFPAQASVRKLNSDMLVLAKDYDASNPNLITKLIPRHYLLEGAYDDGFENVTDSTGAGTEYSGNGVPGEGKRSSVQIILSFLYIWAKYFDELKLYIDSFANLKTVDYESHMTDTVPDNFLQDLVRQTGFYIPQFFTNASPEQYADGENVVEGDSITNSLKQINSFITRRILMNIQDVIRSKGTMHSIKSYLRSVGIDPEKSIKIREFGGPTTKQLSTSRVRGSELNSMIDFTTSSLLRTSYLTGSRTEPGYPSPWGTFSRDSSGKIIGTSRVQDGLLLSGSFTVEGMFKFPPQDVDLNLVNSTTQSLFRIHSTGSWDGVSISLPKEPLLVNVIAKSRTKKSPAIISAYTRPGNYNMSLPLSMSIEMSGEGIFDGDPWYVSFGRFRNDDPVLGRDVNPVSSSFFLRAAKSEWGEITSLYQTSQFYDTTNKVTPPSADAFTRYESGISPLSSGSYISIGRQTIDTSNGLNAYRYLNNSYWTPDEARVTDYVGWVSNLRFWSKGLVDNEFKEHVRNYKSVGVQDPLSNYNYVTSATGSFQKLRLNVGSRQAVKTADAGGRFELNNDAQTSVTASITGYMSGSTVLVGNVFSYGHLSPSFDETSQDDKVRIRSFEDLSRPEALENPWAVQAPSYLYRNFFVEEKPQDDTRLSIEFSLVDALNKDIVNMFATFDVLNNAIGDPNLAFSPDYPALEDLRDVYFNRLSEKMNFRSFLDFYRWFDNNISTFIDQLIPAKTRYKGANFVVESHMLERNKKQYYHNEMYMGEKQVINDSLLIQQLSMLIKKY